MTNTKRKQVTVTATDPIQFAKLLLELGAKGASIKLGSYVYLKNYPLTCEVLLPLEADVENTPQIAVLPVAKRHTKEELEDMTYAELLAVAKEEGIEGKKKVDIIADYFGGAVEQDPKEK